MEKIIKYFLTLLENPFGVQVYRNIKEYYQKKGLTREANAFEELCNSTHTRVEEHRNND